MTELATIPAPNGALPAVAAPAVADVTTAGLDRLRQWVTAAQHAHQLVAPLVDTPFVPDAYRPKVDPRATDEEKQAAREVAVATATAAVLQGISLELDPLTALQQIYVIHGRPGLYAKMMVALVQRAGHEVWTEETTGSRAVVSGRRKGSQKIERVQITMDMARAAGWTRNDAYSKTPADMLWARAASRVCDRIASDVIKGISAAEEIQDDTAQAAPQRTVRRAPRAVATPEPAERPALPAEAPEVRPQPDAGPPPLPGDDGAAPSAETGESITDAQQRKMRAQLKDLGVTDRAQVLRIAGTLVERPVESSTDLTKREATGLIDALDNLLARPDGERRAALDFMLADPQDPPLPGESGDELPLDGGETP